MSLVTKEYKVFGSNYSIKINKGKSITICSSKNGKINENSFKIGDMAEYDSYNLSYYGEIVNITEKTVTIKPKFSNCNRRLKVEEFSWRNENFNLEKTNNKNIETSYYI